MYRTNNCRIELIRVPQHALLPLIEKWKKVTDDKGYGGAILMDLSKAFDTTNHDLLTAKLRVHDFSKESLNLIKSYLTNKWQRTKLNTGFSKWTEILLGVSQGSVLGPLLFNVYINDLFFFKLKTLMSVTMQTTQHFIHVIQI